MDEQPKKENIDNPEEQPLDGSFENAPDSKISVIDTNSLKDYLGIQEKAKSSDPRERLSFYFSQLKENLSQNLIWQEMVYFWTPKKIGIALGVILGVFFLFYLFSYIDIKKNTASAQYRLVNEKISQSAIIRISVPTELAISDVKNKVSFNPEISGDWVEGKSSVFSFAIAADSSTTQVFYFKPKTQLALNKYYEASLNLGNDKEIKADFLAVEDPKVLAVFPDDKLEASENSKITIVFNRPMVPSSEIGQIKNNLPIEISPRTDGNFRWISNTTLQLEPSNYLVPSANYEVKIKTGFVSLDGLNVPESSFKFETRNIRYLNDSAEEEKRVIYNEPIRIYYNQPVDLEKTIKEIRLYDSNNKNISFYAQYAKKKINTSNTDASEAVNSKVEFPVDTPTETNSDYGLKALGNFISSTIGSLSPVELPQVIAPISLGEVVSVQNEATDKSVIEIYNKPNSFDRSYLWDLDSNYTLSIDKVYPLQGNISFNNKKKIKIQSGGVVDSWKSVSNKTSESDIGFFDPAGKLSIKFYEDIDISKSSISSSATISKIEYGQKCSDDDISVYDVNCQKVFDKKVILVSFSSAKISSSEKINVTLKSIYNTNGQKINTNEINKALNTYGALDVKIGKVIHGSNLSSLVLCSSSPLIVPEKQSFKNSIKANFDYEIFNWDTSWRQKSGNNEDSYCPVNYFVTSIGVGFMPEKNYQLELNLEDVFGQTITTTESFTTSKMDSSYVSISPMQQLYAITSPEKTIVSFSAQNINYVDVEICKKTDAYSFYSDYNTRNKNNETTYGENNSINCSEVKKEKISLPEKYWINNYFDVDISKYFSQSLGNYVIKISNSKYNQGKAIFSFLNITNLAVAEKRMDLKSDSSQENQEFFKDLKNIYWITQIKTQEPIEGAQVRLYSNGKIVEGVSNNQGLALVSPVKNLEAVVVEYGNDSTVVGIGNDSLNYANSAYSVKRSYIYTDKSDYKPGETVNIKGLLRTGYDGNYQILDKSANVYITNPKGDKISEQKINLGDYGSFVTSIVLDDSSSLGSYSVCVTDYNCGYFSVLEGTKSTFNTEISTDKNEYISKDTVSLNIDASYYFGVPIENGVVEYSVSARNYYFDRYQTGTYNFNLIDDDYADKFLFKNNISLDSNGKANIKKQIDLDELFGNEKQSKIITFNIVIKDSFGQSTTIKKSVIVHSGESYLGASLNSYFIPKNENIGVKVISTDVNGSIKPLKNVLISFYKIDWVRSGNNWEKKFTFVKKTTVDTDVKGEYYSKSQKIDSEGEYEIRLSAVDAKGNTIYTKLSFYIYGDDGQVGVQVKDDGILNLKTNKDRLRAGDMGEVIVEAPYSKAKALITIERGKIFDYKVVDIVGGFYSYKFKAESSYAPNVYVSVLMQSSVPAVKFAMKSFTIDSDENKLTVKLTTDKKIYGPGETVKLRVFTAGSEATGVPAEVSLSVVGSGIASLDSSKRDPYIFFYNGFPLTISASSNIKNIMSKGADGNSKLQEESSNKNVPFIDSSFDEGAYWKGDILTGNDGYSDISFKLPDSLAYFQAEAIGITAGSKVGVGYLNFNTGKELSILPLKPKFIVPGDSFYVGVKISNQSQEKKSVKAVFSSDTLNFSGKEKEVVLNIEKGDSQSVYFNVVAPKNFSNDFHNFKINITGDKINEIVDQKIIVRPNTTYSLAINSNYSVENKINEVVYVPSGSASDMGDFSVRGSTNMSVFLSDGLDYLTRYPYEGTEQLSSLLKGVAIVKSRLDISDPYNKFNLSKVRPNGEEYDFDELIETSLVKIFRNQNEDGGFSLFGNANSDYYVTLKVLDMLSEMEKSGKIKSDDIRYTKAIDYAYAVFEGDDLEKKVSAGFVLSNTNRYKNDKKIKSSLEKIINGDSLDKLSNQSLAELSILVNGGGYGWGMDGKLNSLLDGRVESDARGIFVSPATNRIWENYENSITDTALYLRSIAIGKRDKNNEEIIRWLLNSRSKDGAWGSTQNTISAIEAIIEYVNWKKETNAEYSLVVNVNGSEFDNYAFNPSKIFDQVNKKVGINDLKSGINLIEFDKSNHRSLFKDPFYYNTSLRYYSSSPSEMVDNGFTIKRSFYSLNDNKNLEPLVSAQTGDVLRAHLEIVVPEGKNSITLEDFIPAGLEILDMDLITDQKSLRSIEKEVKNNYLYPDYKEIKNDRAMIYKNNIEPGVYEFDYYVRALIRGVYLQLPSIVYESNDSNIFGQTSSSYFEIK